jgi:hypothetical protein
MPAVSPSHQSWLISRAAKHMPAAQEPSGTTRLHAERLAEQLGSLVREGEREPSAA